MPRRPRTRSSAQKFRQQTLLGFLSSSPPSSPSNLSPSPGPSQRKRACKTSSPSSTHSDIVQDTDSDVGAIRFESKNVEISDGDHSPRRPKNSRGLVGAHTIPTRTISVSDGSQDELIAVPRHRKGKHKIILDSEDDARPRKRKLIKGVRPPTPEEDSDILEARNQVLDSRLRARGKMTAFQKNLEKFKMLKGKKHGKIVIGSSSSEVEQLESSTGPFKGAKPHHSGESDADDDETDSHEADEEDFIVDDDDTHGVPTAQLPLAFSLTTHQDLTHHFKIVCQFFVHIAVQPLADRRPFFERALKGLAGRNLSCLNDFIISLEEYLSVPLQVTRRKLSGMRDSLVASSVWRSDFKKALETYPKFTLIRLKFAVPQCDACHLGGRLSTLLGRLTGKPYDEYDFENKSDDESDEVSEEGGDEDGDGDGNEDGEREFHLGRFCAARTQVYHRFSHWEYSLYKALQREIMEAQDETRRFFKVAFIGGIEPPQDLHDADRVMEWLDQRGVIYTEWQKVRQMMDSARNLERGETD